MPYTLHYEGPEKGHPYTKGRQVGGPYKNKKKARVALDRADNKYGAYVHRIREVAGPSLGEKAEYMEEVRLAHKQNEQDALKGAVLKEENSMTKAVNHLRD